jgi:hypothetical protein
MKWGLTAILSAGILRERQSPLPDIQPGCDAGRRTLSFSGDGYEAVQQQEGVRARGRPLTQLCLFDLQRSPLPQRGEGTLAWFFFAGFSLRVFLSEGAIEVSSRVRILATLRRTAALQIIYAAVIWRCVATEH